MVKHKDLRFVKKKKKIPSGSYFQERNEEQNPARKLTLRITNCESRNVCNTMGKVPKTGSRIKGFLDRKARTTF